MSWPALASACAASVVATRSKGPSGPRVGYGPHRTIYLTGTDAREGCRARPVQGADRPLNVKTSYSRRGGRADRARNQSAIMRASRRMMNERESAPEGIFGNDRSPCQRRKFRAPESVAARTQFNRNSCRGCALTTRPCDGPRTVAFSPSVKMNDCYQR